MFFKLIFWHAFHMFHLKILTTESFREGHIDVIHYLLNADSDVWNTTSKNGRTPLHTAGILLFSLDSIKHYSL